MGSLRSLTRGCPNWGFQFAIPNLQFFLAAVSDPTERSRWALKVLPTPHYPLPTTFNNRSTASCAAAVRSFAPGRSTPCSASHAKVSSEAPSLLAPSP